jgi:hypothetical protein
MAGDLDIAEDLAPAPLAPACSSENDGQKEVGLLGEI